MPGHDPKADLRRYLQAARDAVLWKLQGLSEYDVRRPMTSTGTNLLGIVKHLASVEIGYFGDTFGRPFAESIPWFDEDAQPNEDMWARADETRDQVIGLYRRGLCPCRRHHRSTVPGRGRHRRLVARGSQPRHVAPDPGPRHR